MILSIFFVLFLALSILYFLDIKNRVMMNVLLIIAAAALVLLAGLRSAGLDKDYYIYRSFWRTRNLKGDVEYSFYLLRNLMKYGFGTGFQTLLLTYALIAVACKETAIRVFSPAVWGSMLIYFSNYFILHEFTQIRIGAATGFLLLSLYYLTKGRYIAFYLFTAIAVFFHQSCFVMVFFPLLRNTSRNIRWYYWVVPIGYLFYYFNTYLNIRIPIASLQNKIDLYEKATESGFMKEEKTNVFNVLFLIRIMVLNALIFYSGRIADHFSPVYALVKIYSFSLFSFLFLAKIPVFAFRTQELLGVVEILLMPCLYFIFPQRFRFLGKGAVWALALVLFLMNIFYTKLLILK